MRTCMFVMVAFVMVLPSAVRGSGGAQYECELGVRAVQGDGSRRFLADTYEPTPLFPLSSSSSFPLIVYSHGRAPYGSSKENVALFRQLCASGHRLIIPRTETTGSRGGDYERIKGDILAVLKSQSGQSGGAPPHVYLAGLSRGAGGMLYALMELPYPISGAIAFAPRGSTVGTIVSKAAWSEKVRTPTVIVSPSNDSVVDYGETSSIFRIQRWPTLFFYTHAGGTHFGYTNRNRSERGFGINRSASTNFPVRTLPAWVQRADQLDMMTRFTKDGVAGLESCGTGSTSSTGGDVLYSSCRGYCFQSRTWDADLQCFAPCCRGFI